MRSLLKQGFLSGETNHSRRTEHDDDEKNDDDLMFNDASAHEGHLHLSGNSSVDK